VDDYDDDGIIARMRPSCEIIYSPVLFRLAGAVTARVPVRGGSADLRCAVL
jgi:hypothetical protein